VGEQRLECGSLGLAEVGLIERFVHEFEPGGTLGGADLKALVRLVETEPPAALGVLGGSAEELRKERGELLDGASERLAKIGPEKWILGDARVKSLGELVAGGASADFVVHVAARQCSEKDG